MFLHTIPYLFPKNETLSRSTLWHWYIYSANFFAEGNRITSLIDWQDIWAGPLFLQLRHPKLVDYNGEVLLKLPDNYESLEEGHEKLARESKLKSLSSCTLTRQKRIKIIHYSTRFSAYIMAELGWRYYTLSAMPYSNRTVRSLLVLLCSGYY